MKLMADVQERYKFEISLVNLTVLLFLFRIAIPIFKYPFLILYICLLIYSFLKYKNRIVSTLIEFIQNYYIILILAFILVFSFITSNKLYLLVFKDFANMTILLSLFYVSTLLGYGKREITYHISNLIYLITILASIISVLGILNLLDIISITDNLHFSTNPKDISDTQISLDYNFAILPSFFGIIAILNLLRKSMSKIKIICYNILLILFSINILLSGSRRGLLLFIALLFVFLTAQIFSASKKCDFLRNLASTSRYFLMSISLLLIIFLFTFFYSDYAFKIRTLETIGIKNIPTAKHKIAYKLFKYLSIIKIQKSYIEFYSFIWPLTPSHPDSGWGTRPHKTIFPLTGENSGILPKGARGYLLDSTSTANYYESINLCESYTLLENLKITKGDIFKASVYCFASVDFDGNSLGLGVRYDQILNGNVSGKTGSSYDFQKKGTWQKLEIEFQCNEGEVPILMSFTKLGAKNLSKLKGYVIFAYPQCLKIDKQDREDANILNHETKTLKNNLSILQSQPIYQFSSMLYFPSSKTLASLSLPIDSDPIRRWASWLISEDTTYYPLKSFIFLESIQDPYLADRYLRWDFALKLFSYEYNFKQKIFGDGFNFLNWYGYYFLKDKTASDWPHNPFLSILLYSGIFGLLIYCFFLYKVFYYYIKYIKEYPILFIFFLITFFFNFFSGGSPFDHPIMGFFSILPFFIHAVHKKEESKKKKYPEISQL